MADQRRLAALPLLLILLLTNCGGVPVPVPVHLPVPAEFATCSPRPPVPPTLDDATVSGWLLDYDDAWADCSDKLGRLWGLVK